MTKKKDWEDVEIPGLEGQLDRANKIDAEKAMRAFMEAKQAKEDIEIAQGGIVSGDPIYVKLYTDETETQGGSNATVTWTPADGLTYGAAIYEEVEPESLIEAQMRARLNSVRALAELGAERQEAIAVLSTVDDRIGAAAREASSHGMTWKEIFAALKARVKNEEDLPTQSQLYTKARKS